MRAALLLLVLVAPLAASAADVIQPGDRMTLDGETQCTLSFVYDGVGDDEGRVFMSIASHCVEGVGQAIDTDNYAAFGTVVFAGDAGFTHTDFAIIEVAPAFAGAVSPEVRGHPGFPTGVANAGSAATGAQVVLSGWGTGFGDSEETRTMRRGVLLGQSATVARIEGPVTPGDSGGPWTLADGRALAVTSKIQATFGCCAPVQASVHQEGPTIQNVLATSATQGYHMQLRTA